MVSGDSGSGMTDSVAATIAVKQLLLGLARLFFKTTEDREDQHAVCLPCCWSSCRSRSRSISGPEEDAALTACDEVCARAVTWPLGSMPGSGSRLKYSWTRSWGLLPGSWWCSQQRSTAGAAGSRQPITRPCAIDSMLHALVWPLYVFLVSTWRPDRWESADYSDHISRQVTRGSSRVSDTFAANNRRRMANNQQLA